VPKELPCRIARSAQGDEGEDMSSIETLPERITWTARETTPSISEDWLSVIIGLFIFVLALAALANVDLIGWAVTTSVWSNLGEALGRWSCSL